MNQLTLILIGTLALAITSMAVLLFVPLPRPTTPAWWALKMIPTTFSPIFAVTGLAFILGGLYLTLIFILFSGSCILICYSTHIYMVTRKPAEKTFFEKSLDSEWNDSLSESQARYMLKTRIGLGFPKVPEPILQQNIPFYEIPGSRRELLCDVWLPHAATKRSGLAFIYVHGSAWYVLDKDVGTRTFFRHLTGLGHVIMDIAYRLYPETDMMGMVHDVRHAIAWLKHNCAAYDVDPNHIVLGGGSAGGHLSLLTAYTEGNPRFTPNDLIGIDTSVRGVLSLYGPADLEALYYHTGQNITTRLTPDEQKKSQPSAMPAWILKRWGKDLDRLGFNKNIQAGLAPMFGGHPDELPEPYAVYSPITHVHGGCPPTFLIQGEHDIITSVSSTLALYRKLREANVPVAMHLIPQTDHAFDLIFPKISPSARNAYFDIERFLAMMCIPKHNKIFANA